MTMADNMEIALETDEMVIDQAQTSIMQKRGRGFANTEERARENKYESITQESEEVKGNYQKSVEGWIIFVTNLHEETSEEDLTDKFGEYGNIHNMHMNLDRRTGFVKGYALIEYKSHKEAKAAIDEASGTDFMGQKIACDFAFARSAHK